MITHRQPRNQRRHTPSKPNCHLSSVILSRSCSPRPNESVRLVHPMADFAERPFRFGGKAFQIKKMTQEKTT